MADGILRLYRSPLKDGEPLYTLSNIDQGRWLEGVHKDEKKPKRQSVFPTVLEDGRLMWEMLDSVENRTYCAGFLSDAENPPFVYSVEYPEDLISEDAEVEVQTDAEPIKKRGRGRPPKEAKAE